MTTKLLSLLAGAALVVTFAAAAAAEPQRLTAAQLDGVTAGQLNAAASLGLGICETGATACSTSAKQSAEAKEEIRIGKHGQIKVKNKAKAKSKAKASAANGAAASLAVGVAVTGVPTAAVAP